MTAIKDKLLAALDFTLDDVNEEQLVTLLVYAYESKKREIERLQSENAAERENLRTEREVFREERKRMHSDPTYWAQGLYEFSSCHIPDGTITVEVRSGRIEVCEEVKNLRHLLQAIRR